MSDIEMKPIFDIEPDDALEARLDAQAEADAAAGRVVPHAKVVAWPRSWRPANELPGLTPEAP